MAALVPETPAVGDEVKPYKIHVSSKYLDLTRQKLELTRLPHENANARSADGWSPKPSVEPLIDYWLERFSWRDQEACLNALPQFRTSLPLPGAPAADYLQSPQQPQALRIHFLHFRSPRPGAVPLLLVPQFPFTNLSLAHLAAPLTDPPPPSPSTAEAGAAATDGSETAQAFHVVIPSLPGLGFSDALPSGLAAVPTSAELLDALMHRLGYTHYLASGTGSARSSPARVDWLLLDRLATQYRESCRGVHFVSPPLARPSYALSVVEFVKWFIAGLFGLAIWGYCKEDFAALSSLSPSEAAAGSGDRKEALANGRCKPRNGILAKRRKSLIGRVGNGDNNGRDRKRSTGSSPSAASEATGLDSLGLREPNTLAYALCDSPTGLLVFVIRMLRLLAGPGEAQQLDMQAAAALAEQEGYYSDFKKTTSTIPTLTYERVITLANLAWLPGPEYALRFWAQCAADGEAEAEEARAKAAASGKKPRVAFTVFLGGDSSGDDNSPVTSPTVEATVQGDAEEAAAGQKKEAATKSNNNGGDDEDDDNGSGAVAGSELAEMADMQAGQLRVDEPYVCPAWGRARFDVAFAQRVPGRPGLLAWVQPAVVIAGVRGLAASALRDDAGLREAAAATVPLEAVVIGGGASTSAAGDRPGSRSAPGTSEGPERRREVRPATIAEETEPSTSTPSSPRSDKGKGREAAEGSPSQRQPQQSEKSRPTSRATTAGALSPSPTVVGSPAVPLGELLQPPARDLFTSDDESPDTIVVATPPLGGTPPVASPAAK